MHFTLRGAGLGESTLTRSRVVGVAIGLYILVVLVTSLHFNISLTPDRIIVLLAIAGLMTGRVRLFFKDWSIFLVVLLAWQVLTGMSRHFGNFRPHVTEMIVVDKWLFFGQVPTIWLQQHFYHGEPLAWYDVAATVLYLLHFAFPMVVAFMLWLWVRPIFVEFMLSFLLVALAGFATFVLFPAAPPWIAANWWHYLPHVNRILNQGIEFFGGGGSYSALYSWLWQHGGWDLFGAMPSEHAAFPFLCFLYAVKAWRRAGWLLLPYFLAVSISVVYLGEHYVADVIGGAVYATLAFVVIQMTVARRAVTPSREVGPESGMGRVSDSLSA